MRILKIRPWQVRFEHRGKIYILHSGGELFEEYIGLFEIKNSRAVAVKKIDGTVYSESLFDRWKHGQVYKRIDTDRFTEFLKKYFGEVEWEA